MKTGRRRKKHRRPPKPPRPAPVVYAVIEMPPDIAAISDIGTILAAIRQAHAAAQVAKRSRDLAGYKNALARRRFIERRGGELLQAGCSADDLSERQINRWRNLEVQTPLQFSRQLAKTTQHLDLDSSACWRLHMYVSEFFVDPADGLMTRLIYAVDDAKTAAA